MPGRTCAIHLTQSVAFKGADGYIGLKDFRGRVIAAMEDAGWIYYGEVCIDKDPQVKAIRTKDAGLQFKSLATDSARMHMALADYLLQFRKPGDNPAPIRAGVSEKYGNPDGWITPEEWIEWAAPVWYRSLSSERPDHGGPSQAELLPDYPGLYQASDGIRETDVMNVSQAREPGDERHLCPLQLCVIERAVRLWSNPGDLVFTPFAGIGSELCVAIKCGRQALGIELKRSYFNAAVRNIRRAEVEAGQVTLADFDMPEVDSPAPSDSDPIAPGYRFSLGGVEFEVLAVDGERVTVMGPSRARKTFTRADVLRGEAVGREAVAV
jgi:hypothetical protein